MARSNVDVPAMFISQLPVVLQNCKETRRNQRVILFLRFREGMYEERKALLQSLPMRIYLPCM